MHKKKGRNFILIPTILCLVLCISGKISENELEAKIQSVESSLVPGPGIVIKGRPIPKATIAERLEAYRVPGVSIAVINDYKIEWANGYGIKNNNEPITSETLFQAASISKPVAAVASLFYVEKGLLDLDEDINLKLKSWKVPENEFTQNNKVTLRGILSHTAGLTVHGFPGYRFALGITESYLGNSDNVLSQSMTKEMLTVVDGNYGLGLNLRELPSLRFGHGGSNEGYRCMIVAWPEKGQGAAIMTNGDYGANLYMEILSSLSEEYNWPSFQLIEKEVIELPLDKLTAYAGEYRMRPAGKLNITVEDEHVYVDKFFVIPDGKKRMEIFPEAEDMFFATESSVLFTFQRDADGKVSDLTFEENGRKREATKVQLPEKKHKLSDVIEGFHLNSYYAGTAFMAAEIVSYDIKKIALSPPYTGKQLEVMLEVTKMAADEYDLPIYVEKDFLTTLLFDESLTKGKSVIFIARNQKALDEYFALKEIKHKAVAEGRLEKVQKELAWSFGRLLSYSDSAIRRLLSR